MTIKTTITEDGKTITERYGDDRSESPIKTRMQEIEEQTGIQLDRDLIIDRSQQNKQPQQEPIHGTNP
jgi:hypothetical protein